MVVESVQERLSEHFLHLGELECSLVLACALERVYCCISGVSLYALHLVVGLLHVFFFVATDCFYLYHFNLT